MKICLQSQATIVVENIISFTTSKRDISMNHFQVDSLALSQIQSNAATELL